MVDSSKTQRAVEPRDVALKMRMDYSHGIMDHAMKTVDEIIVLCAGVKLPGFELDSFLRDAANLISKQFGISNVSIALWDRAKDLYRYRAVVGFEKDAASEYERITYSKDHLANEKTYPSHDISRQTKLYLSEEHPYAEGEESSYARPALLGMKRRSLTDSLEGDYLCIYFSGPKDEILGWIEISGTRLRKLPETSTIKWIELIACIVGSVVFFKGQSG